MNFHGIAETNANPPMDYGNVAVYIVEFEKVLDELVGIKDQIWNAGFIEAYKYVKERESAVLTINQKSNGTLTAILTTPLDELYDEPLTLLVNLPSNWESCTVLQNNIPLDFTLKDHELMFDAVPGGGEITISRDF